MALGRRSISIASPSAPSVGDVDRAARASEAQLLGVVSKLKSKGGTGQEMGSEADGPEVNLRTAALSTLSLRYPGDALLERLPKRQGKVLLRLRADLAQLEGSERQPLRLDEVPDFSWSKNPMSTPAVLKEGFLRRRASQASLGAELASRLGQVYDASDDGFLTHLFVPDRTRRAEVLADLLVQLRAARRTNTLSDGSLAVDRPLEEKQRLTGRIGTTGVLSTFEQRIALAELTPGSDLAARRERALLRLSVAAAPTSTVHGIYAARNLVGLLPDYLGPGAHADPIDASAGFEVSIYNAIHRNYSANTPAAVDHYLKARVFPVGEERDRVEALRLLVRAARARDTEEQQALLGELRTRYGHGVPELSGASSAEADTVTKRLVQHITKRTGLADLKHGLSIEGRLRTLEILLALHDTVVGSRPTRASLLAELFHAGAAWKEVAGLLVTLEGDELTAQLQAVGQARLALQAAFEGTAGGFERQMLVRLDAKLERLSAELLGQAVDRAGAPPRPEDAGTLLIALRSALANTEASDLEHLRWRPKTAPTTSIAELRARLDELLTQTEVSVGAVRDLALDVFRSATEVADTLRGFLRRRERAIHFSNVEVALDPELPDNVVKESGLHYLLALSQSLLTLGLEAKVSDSEVRWGEGVRVLNSVGPRVYDRVLIAQDPAELAKYEPPPGPNDLIVIEGDPHKDAVLGGGLLLDSAHAGPGYSHQSVLAKGQGVSAIALPGVGPTIKKILEGTWSGSEGPKIYVDDRAESLCIMPLARALEQALIKPEDLPSLRPGSNLDLHVFDVGPDGTRVAAERSEHRVAPDRSTQRVEILRPKLDAAPVAHPSFEALAALPLDLARQLAGEKGAVLARLAVAPELAELGVEVPPGMVFTTADVAGLLESAVVESRSLKAVWDEVSSGPPLDRAECDRLRKLTEASLTKLLLKGGKPTTQGRKLLASLSEVLETGSKQSLIARSSFTAEDRPNKSGAGQYSSFPGLITPAQRLRGLAGVIASMWNAGAVESNQRIGLSLRHVFPSVVMQRCLAPTVSGVAVSRGPSGGLGEVSYQAKPKFGGGVDGGPAEEGILRSHRDGVLRPFADRPESLLDAKQRARLRQAVLAIERIFNERIEPGAQHAVDVEWAFVGQKLHILQARVIALS